MHAASLIDELETQLRTGTNAGRANILKRVTDLFPAPGLAMASSAHVYPDIVHGQAILGVAARVADGVAARYGAATPHAPLQRSAA